MTERLSFLWPEIILFATTCVVMVMGLSRTLQVRKLTAMVTGLGLALAMLFAWKTTPFLHETVFADVAGRVLDAPEPAWTPGGENVTPASGQMLLPNLPVFAKCMIPFVALLILPMLAGTVDRKHESQIASGHATFDPLKSNRAEFYAFFLFSITGLMLCASADDLIWLFLALELTSLPTYIMVAISSAGNKAREAGVKYFFLGALGAAVFLYGFALLYGGTGSTNLNAIASHIANSGLSTLSLAGLLLSIIGIGFKIAAVPMHFYTADVYEGAAAPVSGMLAFVPKTAGFIAILLLCAVVGWTTPRVGEIGGSLPEPVRVTLWVIAALTMTVGNVLAILQTSVKRILAYSSIAHSGYMLVGVISGPSAAEFTKNGVAAVLFYLFCYGVMNVGAFAVVAALERSPGPDGEPREIETVDDLRGLCKHHPLLGWCMVICSLSLLGLPPLLGFFGKLPLFTCAITAGEIPLVVVLGLNSAIAAYYYLRLAGAALLESRGPGGEGVSLVPKPGRGWAAGLSAAGVIVFAVLGDLAVNTAKYGAKYTGAMAAIQKPADTQHAAKDAASGAKAESH
jgi:NADH-quinone oxidoreductase subunit N